MIRSISSPSNLHRRATCPGSERLEKLAPPDVDSDDSKEGTIMHDSLSDLGDRRTLNQEQEDCLKFCSSKEVEICEKVFGDKTPKIFREIELQLDGVYGHVDFLAIWKDQAVCLDWKFGRNPVDHAESNMQTRAYAVMVSDAFGVSHVLTGIIQPRLPYEDRVTLSQYGPDDIEASRKQIQSILIACKAPDASLVPDIEACRYCRAKATCPALEAKGDELMKIEPNAITQANAAQVYGLAKLLEKRIDAVKQNIFFMVQTAEAENRKIPGLSLKLGAEKRTITDAQKAFAASGLSAEKFIPCCSVKVTDFEAAFKQAKGMKGKEAKDALTALMTAAGCMEMKRNAPSLALEGDK